MYFRGSVTAVFVLLPMSSIKVPSIICDVRHLRYTCAEFLIAGYATQVRAEYATIVKAVCRRCDNKVVGKRYEERGRYSIIFRIEKNPFRRNREKGDESWNR